MTADQLSLLVFVGAAVVAAGVAAVRFASRAGLPALLLFLLIGLAVGEAGFGVEFSNAGLAETVGTVLLAIILIEGGFTTPWRSTRPVVAQAAVLASVGVLTSVAVTAALTAVLLDVDLRTALVLGAVVSSTDAAAVFAILRRLPVRPRMRALLEAESGANDPPVIVLVVVVTSDLWESASPASMAFDGLYQLGVGAVLGIVVSAVGRWFLARSALPASGLYPLATLAIAMLAFAIAGLLGASGLLACYVAGLWLGNSGLPHQHVTTGFVEALAWLAQIGLFVMLGLLASPARLPDAVLPALAVGAALTFVARPLSVALCLTPFRVPLRDQVFVSWAGLRGAVPIVLATIPMTRGLPAAERVFDTVFLLVVVFVLVQGPLLPRVARATGVYDAAAGREVAFEWAPLEDLAATFVQFRIPSGSRLAGLYLDELRLPPGAVPALVLRGDEVLEARSELCLRTHDHLLLAVADAEIHQTQRRLRALSRRGRLASWFGERGEESS